MSNNNLKLTNEQIFKSIFMESELHSLKNLQQELIS